MEGNVQLNKMKLSHSLHKLFQLPLLSYISPPSSLILTHLKIMLKLIN